MITTIPEYCKQRGVTRQFVYEYIKKGKFNHFEMPVFVEKNGDKIHIGVQKVLEVPKEFAPKKTDLKPITEESIGNLEELILRITDEPFLQNLYRHYLTLPHDTDRKVAKEDMYSKIDQHPSGLHLRKALDEANIRLMQYMVQLGDFMENVVKTANLEAA
jgi:hypothetical protein